MRAAPAPGGWRLSVGNTPGREISVSDDDLERVKIVRREVRDDRFEAVVEVRGPSGRNLRFRVEGSHDPSSVLRIRVLDEAGLPLAQASCIPPCSPIYVRLLCLYLYLRTDCKAACTEACAPNCVEDYDKRWCGECVCTCGSCDGEGEN